MRSPHLWSWARLTSQKQKRSIHWERAVQELMSQICWWCTRIALTRKWLHFLILLAGIPTTSRVDPWSMADEPSGSRILRKNSPAIFLNCTRSSSRAPPLMNPLMRIIISHSTHHLSTHETLCSPIIMLRKMFLRPISIATGNNNAKVRYQRTTWYHPPMNQFFSTRLQIHSSKPSWSLRNHPILSRYLLKPNSILIIPTKEKKVHKTLTVLSISLRFSGRVWIFTQHRCKTLCGCKNHKRSIVTWCRHECHSTIWKLENR